MMKQALLVKRPPVLYPAWQSQQPHMLKGPVKFLGQVQTWGNGILFASHLHQRQAGVDCVVCIAMP